MADCLCANPFHFNRVVKQEIPYKSLESASKMNQHDSGLALTDEQESLIRNDEKQDETVEQVDFGRNAPTHTSVPWLKLAYWEGNRRIGPIFNAYDNCINIYDRNKSNNTATTTTTTTTTKNKGFCLADIVRNEDISDITRMIHRTIGRGVEITHELHGDICIRNKSQSPIFLNGELLQRYHQSRTPVVQKINGGFTIKVYDATIQTQLQRNEPYSLRLSFVKGFGQGYKRQYITNCPCWIEMFFFIPPQS